MEPIEQQAFDLGWDFATFGVDVPEDANKLFCDGYRAYAGNPNRKPSKPDRYIRKWLQVRFGAMRRGKLFSPEVTPGYIEQIVPETGRCPVTGEALTFSQEAPTDWSIDRANNERGYVRGNIIVISTYANEAKSNKSLEEIYALATSDRETDGLTPDEWRNLAILIEPAFGEHNDASPVQMLYGQPVALGMPVSPLASFQAALSRTIIAGTDIRVREDASKLVVLIGEFVCRGKKQRRCYIRLMLEVKRRARHIAAYWEIWGTKRVQRRLFEFVSSLDGSGLGRLAEMQEHVFGENNIRLRSIDVE